MWPVAAALFVVLVWWVASLSAGELLWPSRDGLRAAAAGLSPTRRRARRDERRRRALRADLGRYTYPAGWVRALPAEVGAALTAWPGAAGDDARAFLCWHWRLTYDPDGLTDLRRPACLRCWHMDRGQHHEGCANEECILCRETHGRHAGWCRPDGRGGRIARGVYRDSVPAYCSRCGGPPGAHRGRCTGWGGRNPYLAADRQARQALAARYRMPTALELPTAGWVDTGTQPTYVIYDQG